MLNSSKFPKIYSYHPIGEFTEFFPFSLKKESFVKNSVKKIVPCDVKYRLLCIYHRNLHESHCTLSSFNTLACLNHTSACLTHTSECGNDNRACRNHSSREKIALCV
jgi:hypothetical protein